MATSARTRFEYDAIGNATKITTDAYRSEERSGDAILTYQAIGDAYREVKQEKLGGVALRSYDANGFITGVTQQIHGASPTRRISTDAMGHVLENRELNTGITERFLIAEGQQLAKTGREATYRDVAGVTTQFANVLRPTAQGSSAGSYVVQAGDTLQTIARTVYGDASFWFVLAEANGLSDPDDVEAGQALIVPSTASFGGGTLNGANTVQPYDIMQALGENTPNLPMPADGPACGGMGQIVMVIVAVIVTVYTAGALTGASGFLQTMQAGLSVMTSGVAAGTTSVAATLGTAGTLAVSSAVGSIASQVVGVATGVQEKFSLEQIAMSAISGGVSGGLVGANFGLGDIGNFAARAAVTSTVTQGIAVATGMQDHFSWRSVSASAIGAGIGAAVAPVLGKVYGDSTFGQFGARFTTGLVAGAAAAAARGGRVSSQQVAIDAFGNALGESIAESTRAAPQTPGIAPWSDWEHVNGLDLQTDQAYEARRMHESISQSDTIQQRRLYEVAAANAQEGFRATERAYRLELEVERQFPGQVGGLDLPANYVFPNTSANAADVARGDAMLRAMSPEVIAGVTPARPNKLFSPNAEEINPMIGRPARASADTSSATLSAASKSQDRVGDWIRNLDLPQDLPGVGWLSRSQAASSAQYWAGRMDATGNVLYAIPQGVATLWADHADEVGMALSTRVGGKGVQAGESGAFGGMKGVKGDGLTAHHMPQAAAQRSEQAITKVGHWCCRMPNTSPPEPMGPRGSEHWRWMPNYRSEMSLPAMLRIFVGSQGPNTTRDFGT
ncbi:LysM peptidoglycan-binding domain-containing protein [Ramlibacter sp.]|uniref:LysM peptidoglycan-binding domain-containing protein n=1 Tax=Ramlibacter sp. TaxID=1917967 RepID=UPI003D09C42D